MLCWPCLQELTLTSISTVRLGLPPPPCTQPQQQQQPEPAVAVPFAPPRPFVPMAPAVSAEPVLPTLASLVMDGNFGISNELLAGLLAHAPQLNSLTLVLAGGRATWGMQLGGLGRHAVVLQHALSFTSCSRGWYPCC